MPVVWEGLRREADPYPDLRDGEGAMANWTYPKYKGMVEAEPSATP